MVGESQDEEFKPGAGILFGAMGELKGRGQLPIEAFGDVVEHSGAIEDGPVPVLPRHLFISGVGAGHLDESPPGAFDNTIGALSLGDSSNYLGLVVVDPLDSLPPESLWSKSAWNWRGR